MKSEYSEYPSHGELMQITQSGPWQHAYLRWQIAFLVSAGWAGFITALGGGIYAFRISPNQDWLLYTYVATVLANAAVMGIASALVVRWAKRRVGGLQMQNR
jgi:hypothetical protein